MLSCKSSTECGVILFSYKEERKNLVSYFFIFVTHPLKSICYKAAPLIINNIIFDDGTFCLQLDLRLSAFLLCLTENQQIFK